MWTSSSFRTIQNPLLLLEKFYGGLFILLILVCGLPLLFEQFKIIYPMLPLFQTKEINKKSHVLLESFCHLLLRVFLSFFLTFIPCARVRSITIKINGYFQSSLSLSIYVFGSRRSILIPFLALWSSSTPPRSRVCVSTLSFS